MKLDEMESNNKKRPKTDRPSSMLSKFFLSSIVFFVSFVRTTWPFVTDSQVSVASSSLSLVVGTCR